VSTFRERLDKMVSLEAGKTDMKAICFELALALMECSHARAAMRIGMAKIAGVDAYALALELASETINAAVTKERTP